MMSRRFYVACVLVLSFLLPFVSVAREADLTGSLEAFRVITAEDGDEVLKPADQVSPRDVIEYRLTYRNTGEETVRNIRITDPVPSGTEYIELSATTPPAGSLEFSIDSGKTFEPWPIRIVRYTTDGEKKYVEATPDMVTHIRWVITDTFTPESEVTVSYRTTVK